MFSKLKQTKTLVQSEWKELLALIDKPASLPATGKGSDAFMIKPLEPIAMWRIQNGILQIWKDDFTEDEKAALNNCTLPDRWKVALSATEVSSMETAMQRERVKKTTAAV